MARTLDGPNFAATACQGAHESALRAPYQVTGPASAAPEPAPAPALGAAVHDDPLSLAAAAHLAMHTRYLDGQLRTAEQLVDLLREGAREGTTDAVVEGISAVRDHSVALGEAHMRANEVLSGLLRLPKHGSPDPATATDPARPLLPPSATLGDLAPLATGPGPAPDTADGRESLPPDRATGERDDPADAPVAGSPGTSVVATSKSALEVLRDADFDGSVDTKLRAELASLDPEEIAEVMRDIVAEKTGYSVDMIDPDIDLQTELGIDSLKQMEIAAELWQRYPIFSREEIFRFTAARTVRDFAELMPQVLNAPTSNLRIAKGAPFGRAYLGWRELPEPDLQVDAWGDGPCAVLVDDGGDLARVLAAALRTRGWRVGRLVLPGVALPRRGGRGVGGLLAAAGLGRGDTR